MTHASQVNMIIDVLLDVKYQWINLLDYSSTIDNNIHLFAMETDNAICGIELPEWEEPWDINPGAYFVVESHCKECMKLIKSDTERYGFNECIMVNVEDIDGNTDTQCR
jgi:hypothetical protein